MAMLPALPMSLSGCACTTVGYINTNPISVTINGQLQDGATVSACLDDGCTPATVDVADDNRFEIPQEEPFRTGDSVNPPVLARIVVTADDDATLVDQQLEVQIAQDNRICTGVRHDAQVRQAPRGRPRRPGRAPDRPATRA